MAKKTDKKSKVKKAKKAKKAELSRRREELLRARALEEVRGERLFSEFTQTYNPPDSEHAAPELPEPEGNNHHAPVLIEREVDREAEAILSLYAAMGKEKSEAAVAEEETSKHNEYLLSSASYLLAVAAGLAFLFGATMFMAPGGREAVAVMGGVLDATAPELTNRWVFMLDTLFPIFFGGGLACFIAAFNSTANRPLVRVALTILVAAVLADFSENALAFQLLNGEEVFPVQFMFTSIKYAGLGLAGVITATLINADGNLGKIVWGSLFILFPLLASLLVSGIFGSTGREIAGSFFPFILLLLAVYANRLATANDDV